MNLQSLGLSIDIQMLENKTADFPSKNRQINLHLVMLW